MRSRIEAFARTYVCDNTDHLEALIDLVARYPNQKVYQDQLEAEQKRLLEYPAAPQSVFPPFPTRNTVITAVYDEYQQALSFIQELVDGDYPYDVVERRFNMWRHDVIEQRTAMQSARPSSFEGGFRSYNSNAFAAAFYSNYK